MSEQPDAHVAVVACATSTDGAEVEVASLRAAVAGLPPVVDVVVLTSGSIDQAEGSAIATHGIPAATARAGTDAVKRIARGLLVESLDRNKAYVLRLPAAVDRHAVLEALDRCPGEWCLVADLVAPGSIIPSLVDEAGRPVT